MNQHSNVAEYFEGCQALREKLGICEHCNGHGETYQWTEPEKCLWCNQTGSKGQQIAPTCASCNEPFDQRVRCPKKGYAADCAA